MNRIGPRMNDVRSFVISNPGLPMICAARHVMPHQALGYGYKTIHRAIKAGLVRRVENIYKKGTYLLYPA